MRIAFLGASSQIARDLAPLFAAVPGLALERFLRDPDGDVAWRTQAGLHAVPAGHHLHEWTQRPAFDAIVNFIGAGSPARATGLGANILELTAHYDDMVVAYLQRHRGCRYLFLSSGATYGSDFVVPARHDTVASFPVNALDQRHWYGLAKFQAECRHRARPELNICDIRVFSYVSTSLDMNSRFLLADIVRTLAEGGTLDTSSQDIHRDYISPPDLFALMHSMLMHAPCNTAVDVYSLAPVGKMQLLDHLSKRFGLRYELVERATGLNATGIKPNYFSENRKAAEFGYLPRFDSLSAVIHTVDQLLSQS
ncbi:NAD(P)-dependent oxidoreductase [Herbaspirillum sp. AP02]|uniref:NAD-dependent epimerase/dehydratase family protein n=1 Tax=unclassified Herbaspirillum TaxID=2624150 RepID=UPI0015DA65E8|nr:MULTISPECIES: NAD-dependent epimerase/dehydratase family protein [unclassified Herbaspirillum]MBG7620174.1 NAD(P)-dependent oxidoreductase [Herbaspirillum sp. AP02]NZD67638.1 NAD(P)-dependent oxidoreductase [Herbaspirillum sp. AP21]